MEEEKKEVAKPADAGKSDSIDKAPKQPEQLGNQLANRTRDDIYSRFEKKATESVDKEKQPDPSSEIEESNTDKDLKDPSDTEPTSSDKIVSEKPTSVKKGKGPKSGQPDSEGIKTVPLQALHEARDRFKRLNLEYRDYKTKEDTRMKELEAQVAQLTTKLNAKPSTPTEDDFAEEDAEKVELKRQIAQLQKKDAGDIQKQQQEAAAKVQQDQQKKIKKVSEELAQEGYPGFDIALLKVGSRLQELINDGEITDTESADPSMWKKIYKDDVYNDVQSIFTKREKEEVMKTKTERKKKADLVGSPGKAPERIEESEKEAPSYDQFVKEGVKDRLDTTRKRFYQR
jgi:hypothetical protein